MLNAFCTNSRLTLALRRATLATVLVAGAASQSAMAQGTHLWSQSRLDEFEKGTPQGIAITSDGHLREAPGLKEVLTTPSSFVWSVAVNKAGTAFIGTASPATVLRVGPDGKRFTLFETKDLSVQVVRLGPDGSLYAAVMPSGKVYKLNPNTSEKQNETSATLVFNPPPLPKEKNDDDKTDAKTDDDKATDKKDRDSHYVWDLTFDAQGRLYVATGGPGAVYRVDVTKPSATTDEFFKSDEQHIRSLAWDAKGNLIAGSEGSGLVYRISPQGKGYVLFEASRREITSVTVGSNGTIFAASVGDKSHNPLPPLPVQGTGVVTFTVVQGGVPPTANSSASAPEGTEIYALVEGHAPRKIWSGKDEVVYSLTSHADGLLALSGNRGRIFRIQDDGTFADIGHLDAQQGLSMTVPHGSDNKGTVYIGTGNTGKLFMLGSQDQHEYASDVLDAGALTRFGRVEVQPGSSDYELWTRTGNIEQPVRGWSDWTPLKDGAVASPTGRFLQWKAVLHARGSLGSVGINYLPVNSAPVLDDLVVVPGARINTQNQPANQPQNVNIAFPSAGQATAITFDANVGTSPLPATKDRTAITARWAAHDDNGDDMNYALYLRGDGEHVWRLLKDNITDKVYTFDQTLIPDGGYQIKVIASDSPSHTPGDALNGEKVSDRFEIDTTSPVVNGLKAAEEATLCTQGPCPKTVLVTFDAEDALSPISHAEYSLDAGPWQYVEPVGALSDSKREHYELHIPPKALEGKTGEHLLTVRVYDRHDNVGLAKTVFATESSSPAK